MRAATPLRWEQVLSWRMDRQWLHRPERVDIPAVVRRLAGVQAQLASAAEQAVAVRRADGTGGVAAALETRAVVKTWAQRGTLHLLAAEDAAAYLALLAHARTWEKGSWQREFATVEQLDAMATVAAAVLPGRELSREELTAEIVARTGDPALREKLGSGWGVLLKPLAWQGLLCHGTSRANRVTFTSPASWLPGWTGLPSPDDAAALAVPAYLGAYGPASATAFDQWLTRGASRRPALRGWFAALADAGTIELVQVDGEPLWARTADLEELRAAQPTDRVRLLPAFDQYVLGPGTRDPQVLAPARRGRVSRAAGWIAPVVVAGGRVAGTWEVVADTLAIELFAEAGPVDRSALDAEAAFLERVLDRPLARSITQV